jgi:hypothetical protein
LFGRDVKLPETRSTYRVQNHAEESSTIEGRENIYLLPPQSIRVLSVVPSDAPDIRNVPAETFGDIEAHSFRATSFIVTGSILFVLAVLAILMSLVRFFTRYRTKEKGATHLVSDVVVLRGLEDEFSAIQRAREASNWSPELVGRALTGFRIASCYVLSRPVNQMAVSPSLNGGSGTLVVRGNRLNGTRSIVSSSVTAENVALELARFSTNGRESTARVDRLKELQKALTQFTYAQYGRDATLDARSMDQLLTAGIELARQLKTENMWLKKKFAFITEKATGLRNRVWDR